MSNFLKQRGYSEKKQQYADIKEEIVCYEIVQRCLSSIKLFLKFRTFVKFVQIYVHQIYPIYDNADMLSCTNTAPFLKNLADFIRDSMAVSCDESTLSVSMYSTHDSTILVPRAPTN
jgi:hypothetical protein